MKSWRSSAIQLTLLLTTSVFAILGFGFLLTSAGIYLGSIEVFGRLLESDKELIRLDSTNRMIAGFASLVVSCFLFSLALLRPRAV
ncbi:MAG: hypothetical protein RLY14_984 [Planctomycetota bacterium]|jgi:hypothetical protein